MSVPAAIARRPSASQRPAYLDPSPPIDRRVDDLVSRMTIEEKASQLTNSAAAIPRLGGRPTADRPGFFAEVTIEGEKQLSD